MRCKVGDVVLVVGGCAVGYVGVVVSESMTKVRDWLVEFPRPAPGIDLCGNPARSRHINCRDTELRPIRPDPIPETVTDDIEVSA